MARKMSATSSEVRTASAGGCALSGREHAELVERADHGTHRTRSHLGVECGGIEADVTEQGLDHADIDAVFQQMGRKAMAQRMRADPLGDLGGLRCSTNINERRCSRSSRLGRIRRSMASYVGASSI